MHTFDNAVSLARECARIECCTTAEQAAVALGCSTEVARNTLKLASADGFLRSFLLPGFGLKLIYSPMPAAAAARSKNVAGFLRAARRDDARLRGLLRGYVRFVARAELTFLSVSEQAELCAQHSIPARGFARALVALDSAQHAHIFVTVLAHELPDAAIHAAFSRWLSLLLTKRATLHFVARAGVSADALRETVTALGSSGADDDLREELASIEARIAADKTGIASIEFAQRRAELRASLAAAPAAEGGIYLGLSDVIEAQL